MKKITLITFSALLVVAAGAFIASKTLSSEAAQPAQIKIQPVKPYTYPDFYRGIYLTKPNGKDPVKLAQYIEMAKKSNINVIVIDVQPAPGNKCQIPAENVQMLLNAGIHPIARVVCFQDGLRTFPVEKTKLESIWETAVSAAETGFKEIQFDYIRFEDSSALKRMTLEQKYAFVESILGTAKQRLAKYNVKIAADVFGRIPLNKDDPIGQRMESLDKVVDVICPMAYPSHYTWSKKMMTDPYFTVFTTSTKGKQRVKSAEIVPYIQAFQIAVKMSGLTYDKYIEEQIRAVHDANVGGYIFWNARNDYSATYRVMQNYYKSQTETKKSL